jgi:hypothetical protein
MVISQTQCFLIALVLFGVIGARRGWNREVITSAILLGTVFFLTYGGGSIVANVLANGLRAPLAGVNASDPPTSPACPVTPSSLSNLIFLGMSWLSYQAGTKWGPAPRTHNHRIAGTIPGAMNGAAMAYYTANNLLPGRELLVQSPSPGFAGGFMPEVLGVGLLGLLAVLFIASQATKGGGK